ncbi:uncharacterized protein LOC101073077 [Anopheles sinensis]|uniref:Uncharacterized protein LOC101073077 n=1 Tax=Anopheles sinensis TaxID=74873 RepID=A0A084VBX1_ANOSI|nr:uncharacterized protein LOC101073077 [Anopheles sinensis]
MARSKRHPTSRKTVGKLWKHIAATGWVFLRLSEFNQSITDQTLLLTGRKGNWVPFFCASSTRGEKKSTRKENPQNAIETIRCTRKWCEQETIILRSRETLMVPYRPCWQGGGHIFPFRRAMKRKTTTSHAVPRENPGLFT